MKKRISLFVAMMLSIAVVTGCGSPKDADPATETPGNTASSQQTTKSEPSVDVKTSQAVYTGEAIDEQSSKNVPFLAVIENMKVARPQSGLSQADIVFETLAEGGIPRFMALFQSQRPKEIGPIRSDRVYFNELARSMDLPFAHCGGSQTSIDQINAQKLMSMNQFFNGAYYWRSKTRYAPHNLYTSSELLEKCIEKRGYVKEPSFNLEFDDNYWQAITTKALDVQMKLSGYYSTGYQFKDGYYYKSMSGREIRDKNNNKLLKTKNVVVQITKIRAIANDPKNRVEISMTGSGTGYVFSNGKQLKINWTKPSGSDKIQLTDQQNNPVKLSVGNTWWEIVDNSCKISIDQPMSSSIPKKKK